MSASPGLFAQAGSGRPSQAFTIAAPSCSRPLASAHIRRHLRCGRAASGLPRNRLMSYFFEAAMAALREILSPPFRNVLLKSLGHDLPLSGARLGRAGQIRPVLHRGESSLAAARAHLCHGRRPLHLPRLFHRPDLGAGRGAVSGRSRRCRGGGALSAGRARPRDSRLAGDRDGRCASRSFRRA